MLRRMPPFTPGILRDAGAPIKACCKANPSECGPNAATGSRNHSFLLLPTLSHPSAPAEGHRSVSTDAQHHLSVGRRLNNANSSQCVPDRSSTNWLRLEPPRVNSLGNHTNQLRVQRPRPRHAICRNNNRRPVGDAWSEIVCLSSWSARPVRMTHTR